MTKLGFFGKIVVYTTLALGAVMFMMPLLWMLSTALKPITQAMTIPPTFLPYQYYTEQGDSQTPVDLLKVITAPSLLVKVEGEKHKSIVAEKIVKDNHIILKDDNQETILKRIEILQKIPATKVNTWVKITPEERGETATWSVVASNKIKRRICFRWDNFRKSIEAMKYFPTYFINTIVLCFLTVLGTVTSSALAAYGFSRIEWKGRDKVFLLALATMMIPFPVTMVPMYCLFQSLGMIGTLQPLWIGTFCAGAFNVFLLRQFFMGIPRALSDAARIDGCNEFQIFFKIILPMSKPALMVVGLFQFMGTWNDFLGPLLYLTDQKDFTLALGLQFFQSQHGGTDWNYLMAASALVVIPVLILFFFTQKSFIEGISTSGIKG